MPRKPANPHRHSIWLLAVGVVFLTGCGAPRTDADDGAKQAWQSGTTPQEFDKLRNRLMTSQTDR